MTAEIAILNKMAVALAADSKVTVGSEGQEKTYDTVNKLFTLSKVHPVGVMIYGNAEFMGFPWETLIKMYRLQKGSLSEPTVFDWAYDFIDYITRFQDFTQEDKHQNTVGIVSSLLDDAFQAALDTVKSGTAVSFDEAIKEFVRNNSGFMSDPDFIDSINDQKRFFKEFKPVIENDLKSLAAIADENTREMLSDYLLNSLMKHRYSPLSSGFVVCGFGDKEQFPALINFNTDGYVGNGTKASRTSSA